MKMRLTILVLLLAQGLAWASATDAEQRLRKTVNDAIAVAETSPDSAVLLKKIRPLVLQQMSFSAMTRRAVGPGWRTFSSAQQKKAISLFTELVIRRYASRYTIGERAEVVFKNATAPAPGKLEVPTFLEYKGSKYEVVYRLEQSENWKITDVVIEGVSLIANYRTQFNAPFQKGGPEAVLSALEGTLQNTK